MSRLSRFFILMAAVAVAASCARSARIEGTITGLASSEVVVKLLDINKLEVLDTVSVDESGKFSYRFEVQKGQPQFVYLYNGASKIVSLILEGGDKVVVSADTLGNYSVEGSEESMRMMQVEKDYSAALNRINSLVRDLDNASDVEDMISRRQAIAQEYVSYYRDRVKYVMENSRSMTVVPVLYQTFGASLPVFAQATDAIHFRNAADSLELEYPKSKYVRALRNEAHKRMDNLKLESLINTAERIGYPDIELPDINGHLRKLSEVDSKVVILQFWTATDAEQKMFNADVLKSLYEDFHDKGLQIYQVSLDVDKVLWAQVVKAQQHQWIAVNDSRGTASPYIATYNIPSLPALFIVSNGELVDGEVVDEASLRKLLAKLL